MFLDGHASGVLGIAITDPTDVVTIHHVVSISGVVTAVANAWDFFRSGENKLSSHDNYYLS